MMMMIRLSKFIIILLLLFHFVRSNKNIPPVIVEQPQDVMAELDKPMALHCRAESSSLDDLRVDWYKDGRRVMTDPNARIITEFMALHVINTMVQDAGAYYCVASNTHGRTQSRTAHVQFRKLDKDFVVSPMSTVAAIGERIRLRCEPPHGSPVPSVYWTKDGKNLSVALEQSDLILSSIQPTDFGSYRCIASNGIVRYSNIAHLTEFRRPTIRIRPSSPRIDIRRGQSIELQCQVESSNDDDQFQIEWHRTDGKLVGRNDRIDLSSVQFDDSGIYTCVIHINGRREHVLREHVLLAVHDRSTSNNIESIFSESNMTVFAGRSAILDCLLPSSTMFIWSIVNRSDISLSNNVRFEFLEHRLKIRRIEETDHDLMFECHPDGKQLDHGLIRLHVERIEPPPILLYVPNNQTVPIGVEVLFSCQPKTSNTKVQWSFISALRSQRGIKIETNNRKYRIETNGDLIIRQADKNDSGIYKCLVKNQNQDETIWSAHLHVEDATRANVVFQRVERKDLPPAPSQPLAVAIMSDSIELAWNIQTNNNIDGYLIEYFSVNTNETNLEWQRLTTMDGRLTRQIINNLKISSTYQFQVRARNSFGYGLPSPLSELIETRNQQQSIDELVRLLDPYDVQETSITLKWIVLRHSELIERFAIHIVTEQETTERVESLINSNSPTIFTVNNLRPNTDYTIRLVPMRGSTTNVGRASNSISIRTSEGIPSSSPTDVTVELTSITSLSIKWNPPLAKEQNGRIVAYKVNCLGSNETSSIRLMNISADAKGLHIKSLIENMQYCISVAARTRIGYGPYSQPFCVTMNADFLRLNRNLNQNGFQRRLRDALSQPWFLPVLIVSSILFTCALSYAIWLCFRRLIQRHRHRIKFGGSSSSTSSSGQFVEMPVHKTLSNGTRYDLIKDTPPPSSSTALWADSMANGVGGIRLQCCTTTTGSAGSGSEHEHSHQQQQQHHSMNIHKNPINALLHECRQQQQQQQQQQQLNPYATTGIFQHHHSPQPVASTLPTYSESVRSPSSFPVPHQLLFDHHNQQISTSTVQYQPPWLDHPSSTQSHRSQPHTPYHHHPCIHCSSQSHPHTPSSIRTTPRSPSFRHYQQQQQQQPPNSTTPATTRTTIATVNTSDIRWPAGTIQTLNSSPLAKRHSHYAPPPLLPPPPVQQQSAPQATNSMMINSLGGETMTTSWASSTDTSNRESASSSNDGDKRKRLDIRSRSSSEGSLFTDSDVHQEPTSSAMINHERRPTFLMPDG